MDKNKIYSVEEVSEILQISPYTVAKQLREGVLPGKKIGKVWRVLGSELLDYMKDSKDGHKD